LDTNKNFKFVLAVGKGGVHEGEDRLFAADLRWARTKQLPEVVQILRAAGCEFVFAEVFEIDKGHSDASHTGCHPVRMAFSKSDSINVVGHLHTHGWKSDADDAFFFLKQFRIRRWIVEAKVTKHALERRCVACGIFDKEINVAGISSIAMIGDCVTTDNYIANTVAVKQPYKIAEVCG